jgi:hypothetical protein
MIGYQRIVSAALHIIRASKMEPRMMRYIFWVTIRRAMADLPDRYSGWVSLPTNQWTNLYAGANAQGQRYGDPTQYLN